MILMTKKRESPTVVIDTREQTPLEFELPTVRGTLDTGDYSVLGLEHLIAVERKSLSDFLGCVGHGRDRFKRELQRMRAYRFRLLVIETDARTIEAGSLNAAWRSALQPAHVMGALAAWIAQYGITVWLAGDHAAGGRFVERYLRQCARRVAAELQATGEESNDEDET